MSVGRMLTHFVTTDALLLKVNLVSIGVLMIIVGQMHGALGDIGPNSDDPTLPVINGRHEAGLMDGATNDKQLPGAGAVSIENETGFGGNDVGFVHAFVASLSVILVSELGDKTFFIAAIMAMRHPRLVVFAGAIAALGLMTVLSAVFGMAATIIPRVYTYYISTALFAIFGLKMLKDGYYMSPADAQEELEEVQSDLKKREDELLKSSAKPLTIVTVEPLEANASVGGVDVPLLPNNNNNNNNNNVNNNKNKINSHNGFAGIANHHHHMSTSSLTSASILRQVPRRISGSVDQLQSPKVVNGLANGVGGSSMANDLNAIELKRLDAKDDVTQCAGGTIDPESLSHASSMHSVRSRASKKNDSAFVMSRVLMQAFTMTFLAEWGDRSQLTTIILSATENVLGVIVGGVLGHSMCTGLAVIGGRMIAQRISVRTVTLVGGVVFLLFALSALIFGPGDEQPPSITP